MDERNSGSGDALGSLNRAQEGLGASGPVTGTFRADRASRLAWRFGTPVVLPAPASTAAQRGAMQGNAARIDAGSFTLFALYHDKSDILSMAPDEAGMRTVTSRGQAIDRSRNDVQGDALQSLNGGAVPWQCRLAAHRFQRTASEPVGDCPAGNSFPSHF